MIQYALIGFNNYHVEISNEHFEHLRQAKRNIFAALAIEDKFNLLLENYAEFEQELFKISIENTLFQTTDDWSSGIDEIHSVNRRIINLFTMCCLYIDQSCHNIASIYGTKSAQHTALIKQQNQEYDSACPSYRIMAAMRNYVQHRELPVYLLTKGRQRIENNSGVYNKHTIKLGLDIKTLSEDKRFKTAILSELKELGESVELTLLIRQYLESLGRIHLKVRELISSNLPQWEELIRCSVSQYREATGYSELLSAVSYDESGIIESVSLFENMIERRKMLENKNRYAAYYSRQFISNESPTFDSE